MALISMAEQFQGLPMDSLIGGPLTAAANAQIMLARSTANFINSVGFDPNADGSLGPTRYVNFSYDRPNQIEQDDGTVKDVTETVQITVPLLSIVPVPNLQIDNVDIMFDMEVKSAETAKSSTDVNVGWEAQISAGYGPFKISVKVQGQVKTHSENTRSSDNSARYHVEVKATNHGMPEGLARVFDIMAASVAPTITNTVDR